MLLIEHSGNSSTAVFATVMISSLSAIFIDLKDNVNASVPLPTPIPYLQLLYSANSSSNFLVSLPKI